MDVGFQLTYRPGDQTAIAFRLASFAESLGYSAYFFDESEQFVPCHPKWDQKVDRRAHFEFREWADHFRVVVLLDPFTARPIFVPPDAPYKTVALADIIRFDPSRQFRLSACDDVICGSTFATEFFQKDRHVSKCRYVPFDFGLPATRKVGSSIDRVKLVVPAYRKPNRDYLDLVDLVAEALAYSPTIDVSLVYCPKDWPSRAINFVRRLAHPSRLGNRFRLHDARKLGNGDLALYAGADLTVWPSETGCSGLAALRSLSMGTPVVAYDLPVSAEYLKDGRNASLVPCELYSSGGLQKVAHGLDGFRQHLLGLLSQPDLLRDMRNYTRLGLSARSARFQAGWEEALQPRQ